MMTSITNEYTSYKNISLTLYSRMGDVSCVWEVSGDKDGLLFWPKFFLAHSSTSFSCWLGVAQPWVTEGPKPSVCSWFSLRHLVSNWLKPSERLVILLSNTHLLPLFFHLFTQVYLLTDGLVEGQYITLFHFPLTITSSLFLHIICIYPGVGSMDRKIYASIFTWTHNPLMITV